MKPLPITVTIIAKNSASTIQATLDSTKAFAEVLLCDTGSQDNTLEIAASYPNVKIHTIAFTGFGPTHNTASALATYDWVLSLDSDEVLSKALIQEIEALPLVATTVYSIHRNNYFNGKLIRGCSGWYPDRVVRLYHRKAASFSTDAVHEKIIYPGLLSIPLKNPIEHTPYRSISDFLNKMELYSSLFALQHQKCRRTSYFGAWVRGWLAFIKSFWIKQGFRCGFEGFIISRYIGDVTFYKYLKLKEINQKQA